MSPVVWCRQHARPRTIVPPPCGETTGTLRPAAPPRPLPDQLPSHTGQLLVPSTLKWPKSALLASAQKPHPGRPQRLPMPNHRDAFDRTAFSRSNTPANGPACPPRETGRCPGHRVKPRHSTGISFESMPLLLSSETHSSPPTIIRSKNSRCHRATVQKSSTPHSPNESLKGQFLVAGNSCAIRTSFGRWC
ncbi:MAG: hypothetical protein Ct9H300mP1_37150 [Planctomycetaceae bacterium]|nr:MAG: hypothetical protein Ct9H300mP1_37150 [Planctomycetaceae bacterium]